MLEHSSYLGTTKKATTKQEMDLYSELICEANIPIDVERHSWLMENSKDGRVQQKITPNINSNFSNPISTQNQLPSLSSIPFQAPNNFDDYRMRGGDEIPANSLKRLRTESSQTPPSFPTPNGWNNRVTPNVYIPQSNTILPNTFQIPADSRLISYPPSTNLVSFPTPQNMRSIQDFTYMQQLLNQHLLYTEQAAVLRRLETNTPSPVRFPLSENTVKPPIESIVTQKQDNTENAITNRFTLLEQPNEHQRKSYGNENRCLHPNPIVVCPRDYSSDTYAPKILDGQVTISIVDNSGNPIPECNFKVLDGENTRKLDKSLTAHFSMKVLDGNGYLFPDGEVRLHFLVQYKTATGSTLAETILSRPFYVRSNRGRSGLKTVTVPVVEKINPGRGKASEKNEIWIKGKNFVPSADKLVVAFGDVQATIMPYPADNLIAVVIPARPDLKRDLTVPVFVGNRKGKQRFMAQMIPSWTYIVEKPVTNSSNLEETTSSKEENK